MTLARRRSKLGLVLLAATLLVTSVSDATIKKTNGIKIEAPLDAGEGALEHMKKVYAWDEDQDCRLSADLSVDSSGEKGVIDINNPPTAGVIPESSCVSSHLLHYDPRDSEFGTARARFRFEQQIIGIIFSTEKLNCSDYLGDSRTTYPNGFTRGLEFREVPPRDADWLSVRRKRLNVALANRTYLDEVRVLTKCKGNVLPTELCPGGANWNAVGSWKLWIDHSGWGEIIETIELGGSDTGGALTGWARGNQQKTAGTWEKAGDSCIRMYIDYRVAPNNTGAQHTVDLWGSSSQSDPNSMSGRGTWRYQAFFNISYGVNFTATRTSNLQSRTVNKRNLE